MQNASNVLTPLGVTQEEFPYWEITIDYGLSVLETNIKWANRCIDILKDRAALEKK